MSQSIPVINELPKDAEAPTEATAALAKIEANPATKQQLDDAIAKGNSTEVLNLLSNSGFTAKDATVSLVRKSGGGAANPELYIPCKVRTIYYKKDKNGKVTSVYVVCG